MKKGISLCFIRFRYLVIFLWPLTLQIAIAQNKFDESIPLDKNVIIRKLDNGLTYYIRKNQKPEKRVEFRLAVNAGSVLEDEDQQGLAHFVEHMAFNGTKNFKKNELVSYLQSVGVQFGPEINAFTSFDETVYQLTLPTDSADILEKGFQIMEDWAHNLLFDDEEIDKERGVIVEEWRLGRGPFQRMQDKYIPLVFKGSLYAERLPIGKKEVIEGAPHEKIRKFYSDWYRPDLMAFVVVGDIDPEKTEKSIQQHFGRLQIAKNPRSRISVKIPDQPGTSTLVLSDKEAPYTLIQIICKHDPQIMTYLKDYRNSLIIQLATSMLNDRLEELKEQANPPILYSFAQYGNIGTRAKDAFQLAALVPENGIQLGIQTLITESERVIQYGFTDAELQRQKKKLYSFYESAYNERDKTESKELSNEYVRNFLTAEPIPGIEFEYGFVKEYIDGITLEEVNETARRIITRDNRVVIVMAPQKEELTLPDDKHVLDIVEQFTNSGLQPYEDKITGEQLMTDRPGEGKIISTKEDEAIGVFEMNLSNGARVILKPTDFKNDEILFSAYSPGGYSLYNIDDFQSAVNAADIVGQNGVATYSPSDISKLLAGKKLFLTPFINAYSEGVSGMAAPDDMESLMQLNYLFYTMPRKDSALFESYIAQKKGVIKNLLADPENFFQDQFIRIKTQNNPRAEVIPTEADIDRISLNRVMDIYKDRFSNASDFIFFFVGSFNTDSIKPLIETYIASLPSKMITETWRDMGIRAPEKKVDKPVYKGNDPKSMVAIYSETEENWNPLESHLFESLEQLLDIRYNEVLREEMSGIYGMGVNLSLIKIPYEHLEVSMYIPCSPENTDRLTKAALDVIRTIRKKGVGEEDLNKIKESQRRELEKNIKENGYWIRQLVEAYRLNDPGIITQYIDRINAITSANIKEVARKIDLKNYVRVVLYPEK
jgi:zinc protease